MKYVRKFNESSRETMEIINECFIDLIESIPGSKIHAARDTSTTFLFIKPIPIRNVDLHLPSLIAYTDSLSKLYHDIYHSIEKVYTMIDRNILEVRTNPGSVDKKEAIIIQISLI